jgi:rod shape-determining protein RodA
MAFRLSTIRSSDWWLTFGIFTLILFGMAAIYSVALSQEGGDFLNVKKQLLAIVIGLLCYLFLILSNYRLLRSYSKVLYGVGVLLLIGVLFFGSTIRGTTGWFDLGFFSFQPVEFMKVALAVILATYCAERARRVFGWREVFETIGLTALPVFFTLMQPDFGSAMLLIGMWLVVVLFAGIRKIHMFSLGVLGVIMSIVGWGFLLADYQRARLMTFVDPTADPLGQGYNVTQAIIAVGAGGWFGSGLGFGSQSQLKFLPESQTDFIFAVIAEELGFIGICLLLFAFALVFLRIVSLARKTRDSFAIYLLICMGGVMFLQFMVNIGMNIGLLPVTGLGLPLVSYGGSSLILFLIMMGVVQNIAASARTS